jgi:hypothetical protein
MKSTRFFRNFIFLFSLLGLGSLSAVEYKTLMSTSSTPSETITLQDGDLAEILSLSFRTKFSSTYQNSSNAVQISSYLQIVKSGITLNLPQSFYQFYNYTDAVVPNSSYVGHIIVGPAILQCKGDNCIASIKITTATELAGASQSIAKYASVIPENAKTNVSVILEQSTDLVNWTAANPGDFTPSTSKRFFRVRTANVPVAITGASNAAPIVITSAGHGLSTGDAISVSGVAGNTAANGVFTITKVDDNSFSLNGTTGNAAYTSGGTWLPSP